MKMKNNKESLKSLSKTMFRELEEIYFEVKKNYANDGTWVEFLYSSNPSLIDSLLARAKKLKEQTKEQLSEECIRIRNNVKNGIPGNIEIQFNEGRQLSDKRVLPLGNTVIKILPMDESKPNYIFIKAGNTLDALIFIGGNDSQCIMVFRDENGDDFFLRLSEFHMLSLVEDPDPRKEIGLITSYIWLTAKVHSSVVLGFSLAPIKNLLLSDWFQAEWERIKDTLPQSADEEAKGESNE